MARFVIPVTIEIYFETASIDEAKENFYKWRKFVREALRGHLAEVGVCRISIPPIHEVIEVDAAWLENRKLRTKFRQEWNYEEHQRPVIAGSKRSPIWTHRIAIGPKPAAEQKRSVDYIQPKHP